MAEKATCEVGAVAEGVLRISRELGGQLGPPAIGNWRPFSPVSFWGEGSPLK